MILAGIDEAGYGPMLGPLVVSVAVFRVPGEGPPPNLWRVLAPAVRRKVAKSGATRIRGIPVNDSKKLFHQGKGVVHLEEGVLPFVLSANGTVPPTLRSLLEVVGRGPGAAYLDAYPWYRDRDVELPRDTYTPVLRRLAEALDRRLQKTSVEFLGLAAIPVEVREFNGHLAAFDNKSRITFIAVTRLLEEIWKRYEDEPTEVMIDRQGGRSAYAPLLAEALRPRGICIDEQGSESCVYRLHRRRKAGADGASFRVTFLPDCEEKCLPVALASMLSKYVRELHMTLFNAFWAEQSAGLKPTAGYFGDARRFLRDIAELRLRLAIDESLLVRRR